MPIAATVFLIGKIKAQWQNTAYVTGLFDKQLSTARRRYRAFAKKGIADGKRDDLVGGGLIRSAGGWAAVKALRKAKVPKKGDERILGDGDFVQNVLAESKEAYERKYRLKTRAIDLDYIAGKAAKITGIDPALVWSIGRQNMVVHARGLLCNWATHELGMSQASLSQKIGLTPSAISLAVVRGQELVKKHNYNIEN